MLHPWDPVGKLGHMGRNVPWIQARNSLMVCGYTRPISSGGEISLLFYVYNNNIYLSRKVQEREGAAEDKGVHLRQEAGCGYPIPSLISLLSREAEFG